MGALKDKLEEIKNDIKDVFSKDFSFLDTQNVPSLADRVLTYESGKAKRGETIETCVLFVDIRDSVRMNNSHYTKTMGKMYTAFVKAVLKMARHHGGYVRNIIGDRVMVVFPVFNCFKNAVECAISINHLARIMNDVFKGEDFKCGIGIDYGKMSVIKVGIEVHGEENSDNKGLVWVGTPANLASRLTDYANKTMVSEYWHVEGTAFKLPSFYTYSNSFFGNDPLLIPRRISQDYNTDDFLRILHVYDGSLHVLGFSRVEKCEKRTVRYSFSPILIAEKVYTEYNKLCHKDDSIEGVNWEKQECPIQDIGYCVYGADLYWNLR